MSLLAGQGRLVTSAGVRVGGAALVLAGIVVGLRVLGPTQFGVSVLVLSVGQLIAFPMTAMERLVVRLVAQGEMASAALVLRRGDLAAVLGVLVGGLTAGLLAYLGRGSASIFALAVGFTVASAGLVTLRQGANRAAGRLAWGQVPNEVFRPLATLVSYPLAEELLDENSGALATLMASAATLVLMLLAPRVSRHRGKVRTAPHRMGGAALSLMVVSVVALAVERLYPIIIGWTATPAEVAVFAVVLRVIQLGNFSQAFGVFYYSPQLARAASGGGISSESARLTRRIRVVGLLAALPVSALCVLAPGLVEQVLGSLMTVETELRVAVIGVLANVLGSPAQTLLIMAGRERLVGWAYSLGAAASAVGFVACGANDALDATVGLVTASLVWSTIQIVMVRRVFGTWQ